MTLISRNMRSPSFIHQPFPISQITPSTIVLGSSFYSSDAATGSSSSPDDSDPSSSSSPSTENMMLRSSRPRVDTAAAPAPSTVASSATESESPSHSPTSAYHHHPIPRSHNHQHHNPAFNSYSTAPSSLVAALESSINSPPSGNSASSSHFASSSTTTGTTPDIEGSSCSSSLSGSSSSTATIAIPFSNRQIEASSVLVTSNDPPERCTSPRRDNNAIEQIGREKVHVLRKEAELMQDSLTDILDRIVLVRDEYDRLSGENRFLQDYIGNLMSTSNILNRT